MSGRDETPAEIAARQDVERLLTPELQSIAREIQSRLPAGWGFGLFAFQFDRDNDMGPCLWVSNAQRDDMVRMLLRWLSVATPTSADQVREWLKQNTGSA